MPNRRAILCVYWVWPVPREESVCTLLSLSCAVGNTNAVYVLSCLDCSAGAGIQGDWRLMSGHRGGGDRQDRPYDRLTGRELLCSLALLHVIVFTQHVAIRALLLTTVERATP